MRRAATRLFVSLSLVSLAAVAAEPAGVSDKLGPSADETLAFVLNAQGMQIYACKPGKDAYTYAWAFVAPEATLLEKGVTVGRHYAGPTWESSSDRSSVKGAVRERQDGGTGNIPWLLLGATPAEMDGKFAKVTSIQRLATRGGVEPTEVCNEANKGKEVRVPYTADYYFYKRK